METQLLRTPQLKTLRLKGVPKLGVPVVRTSEMMVQQKGDVETFEASKVEDPMISG